MTAITGSITVDISECRAQLTEIEQLFDALSEGLAHHFRGLGKCLFDSGLLQVAETSRATAPGTGDLVIRLRIVGVFELLRAAMNATRLECNRF
jgi:hypothetical protein